MSELAKLPIDDLVRAAERELAMRERVYPNWVKGGRMPAEKAAHEIKAMRQIADVLAIFQKFEVPLRDCIRQRLADLKEFERHPAVENIRDAFPDAELIIHDLPTCGETKEAHS
ncbi:MAG: hypothetical protein C0519_14030 [Hyphomicrobium sp.]|nr:hypothetical protein [Hyphomicrobium sp.]PPD06276.1 MAG: hypothetical protein CTY28_14415 [Hyphomicrobium sp.]